MIGVVGVLMYQRTEVTKQALLLQRGLKRQQLRWEEAKLFAIVRIMDGEDAPRFYELSGEHALLRWSTFPPRFGMVSRPKEKEEYERMLHDLLAYIRARTSLPLLNLS